MSKPTMTKITSADPASKSLEVQARNVEVLKTIFPDVLTEGPNGTSVNIDILKQLIGDRSVTEADEKFGLMWHGKRAARQLALTPSTGTLRPCPEESVNWEQSGNILIEGDNLEVLKLLQKGYAGRIKLIYIDPPYNTGKDFVYPDDFRDNIRNYLELSGQVEGGKKVTSNPETNGRFHTDWLKMMYPRLRLARNLLAEDGAIFISIDDNELSSLKIICDDIFGHECFAGCVARLTGTPTGGGFRALVNETDNVLIYLRDPDVKISGVEFSDDDAAIYDREDKDGKYLIRSLRRTGGEDRREDRPSMYYPMIAPDGTAIYPIAPAGYQSRWICGKDRYEEMKSEGLIEWHEMERSGKTGWQVYQKFYLEGRLKQPSNLWSELEGNKKATRDLKALFGGEKVFSFPKPVGLIRHILQLSASSKDSIILDFFAGSGTTGHAVMAHNAADDGARRYILVQFPEPLDLENKDQRAAAEMCRKLKVPQNIAELTKERLRRAGRTIKKEHAKFKGDLGFRVFKLDSTNINEWEPKSEDIKKSIQTSIEHLKANRTELDILYELLLKVKDLDLCVPVETKKICGKDVFAVGSGVLMACLAQKINRGEVESLAKGIVAWHKEQAPVGESTCVFRDSAFADDVAKTNMAAILQQHGITKVQSL
jgi:adenine-specific DNA-methyltransferase